MIGNTLLVLLLGMALGVAILMVVTLGMLLTEGGGPS